MAVQVMRVFAWLAGVMVMAGCRAVQTPVSPLPTPTRAAVVEKPTPQVPFVPPAPPRVRTQEISSIVFEGVAFDSRSLRLAVVDQPGGPGSKFADAAAAAGSLGAFAATNAGFFTPEGAPLGRVISRGKAVGSWNTASSLGSGIWYETAGGQSAIVRRGAASGGVELIQAGPLLVENRHAVGGLESVKSSVRTMILWDGGTRWWLGRSSACTLAALSQALAAGSPAGWPVHTALNLDGGRSADLWISSAVPGGPLLRRAIWNRPVRNFLVLLPR